MSAVFHRNLRLTPPAAVRGEGCYLHDAEGRAYLDASGGAAVSCLGHSHPRVIQAVQEQVARLAFAHTSFFTNEPAEELARRLIEIAPPGFGQGRVMFLGSGSEAVEAALKLARQYFIEIGQPQRTHYIARRMSYHGNSLGALSIGGHAARRAVYEPLLMKSSFVSPCHPYRGKQEGETDDAYGDRLAIELDQLIQRLGPETVAAFVLEPVSGATLGSAPPVEGYMRKVRAVCDRYGVLMIADEVMCGMGRTGDYFVSAREGVTPDIITLAKGLGAGYQPIGAALAGEKVVSAVQAGTGLLANGHTYMSHAVVCAASLAVLNVMRDEDLLTRVRVLGEELEQALKTAFGEYPHVGDIRGRGLFWSIELVADRRTKATFPKENRVAQRIKERAQSLGLICYPGSGGVDGQTGDHILLAPPFVAGSAQIEEAVSKLSDALGHELPLERLAS